MDFVPWANSQLSGDLPSLARGGENEIVEFKRELPKQVRDLAKEIAAFASTRGGRLILGVDDSGAIVGIPNAHDPTVRDDLGQRIVGICQTISPPVRPDISWALASGVGVLVITVEKGAEPLYYVDSRAYIRHDTVSRPATPAEVHAATVAYVTEVAKTGTMSHHKTPAASVRTIHTFESTSILALRPWVQVEVGLAGPLVISATEVRVQLGFTLKNVGKSPALNTAIDAMLVGTFGKSADDHSINRAKKLREEIKSRPLHEGSVLGQNIFPDQTYELVINVGVSVNELYAEILESGKTMFCLDLFGFVSYRTIFNDGIHLTPFGGTIGKPRDQYSNIYVAVRFDDKILQPGQYGIWENPMTGGLPAD